MEKFFSVLIVNGALDMLMNNTISDEEIEKVLMLKQAYSKIGVYAQQRINMFDYISKHWND